MHVSDVKYIYCTCLLVVVVVCQKVHNSRYVVYTLNVLCALLNCETAYRPPITVTQAKDRVSLCIIAVKFPGLGHGLQTPDLAGTSQGKRSTHFFFIFFYKIIIFLPHCRQILFCIFNFAMINFQNTWILVTYINALQILKYIWI